jgi:hypothetical protein
MLSDSEYFARRAAEERLAAERSVNPSAREAHLELAARYDQAAATTQGNVFSIERRGSAAG